MKQILISLLFGLLVTSFCTSCEDRFEKIDKFQRPEHLKGKIYTVISEQDNMSIFAQLMVEAGYDKVLDKTGTYAAFVPSNSVMEAYLSENYGTTDLSAIDSSVKSTLVKYHVLTMPWSKTQLQTLNSRGWINLTDISNNEPTAFKRRTLLREPNRTYNIQRNLSGEDPFDVILPDDQSSSTKRTVYSSSAKYVPLFFDGFMGAAGLGSDDYSFYFDRPYEYGEVYYANAKILGDELFAENGFIYTIDQVVEPLKNAEQLMEAGSYSQFLQLIHNNSVFQKNTEATLAQEGASEGQVVEDLYDLSYTSILTINIHSEIIGSSISSVEQHNGLLAPTDAAMDAFFDLYLKRWGNSWSSVPTSIRNLFVKAHMSLEAVYPKDMNSGFYNGVGDIVNEEDFEIEEVAFGSNSTFIGLSKAVVPKYISSVSAPLFLDPNYNSFFYAYAAVDLLSAMKNPTTEFSLFIMDNQSLALDSTIFASELPNGRIQIMGWDHGEDKLVNMLSGEYKGIFRRNLYGHIGVQPLLGLAKREFIETVDGRHIVVQNDTVSGGVPSEFGFQSGRDTTVVFKENLDFPITNGKVYECDGWIKFPTTKTYNYFRNSTFLNLLDSAGLATLLNERLTFLDPTERYTIFFPSNAALEGIQIDTFTLAEIEELVSFHIVKGDLIFTDGRQPKGAYRTFNNKFINLDPQVDNLLILDENENVLYDELVLSSGSNLIGMHLQDLEENYYITNAVVHKINTVIMPY